MKKTGSRAYNVWTEREEQALRTGVKRYGVGAWEMIRQDKDFAILKKRSGVQLKDKWRNLVKFRKLNEQELRNLPTRASGPWSRRGLSRRSEQQEEAEEPMSDRGEVERDPLDVCEGDRCEDCEMEIEAAEVKVEEENRALPFIPGEDEDEEDYMFSALQRRSERTCTRSPRLFTEYFTDFDEQDNRQHRKKRHLHQRSGFKRTAMRVEDRRFGIYDVRRYVSSHPNEGGRTSNNDSTTVTNDTSDEESYVVECPCGVTYDDGKMMIECECCIAWAHVDCLKRQMDQAPGRYRYDFETYLCDKCQRKTEASRLSMQLDSAPDQGSSISDDDIWHPLALALVPRGKRLPRRKRMDLKRWCNWLRPLYPHAFVPPEAQDGQYSGIGMGKIGELKQEASQSVLEGPPAFGMRNDLPVGMGMLPPGMDVSTKAQILTELLRWMSMNGVWNGENQHHPSAAQLASLASLMDHRMFMPAFPLPGGMGFVPTMPAAPQVVPPGLMPSPPPQKKMMVSHEIAETGEFQVPKQVSSEGRAGMASETGNGNNP